VKAGFPADSFMAVGALGQRTVIVPASNLVVVRLGVTQDYSSSDYGVARLVSDVIAAVGNGS
jgi:CubicO group peptidase (beta-lactamase class C family)